MKKLLVVVSLFAAQVASACQETGPVLEITDAKIVIQKGKEQWVLRTSALNFSWALLAINSDPADSVHSNANP